MTNRVLGCLMGVLLAAMCLSACIQTPNYNEIQNNPGEGAETDSVAPASVSEEPETEPAEPEPEEEPTPSVSYTDRDLVVFNAENAFAYCDHPVCRYDAANEELCFSLDMTQGIPISDDDKVYLFETANYETEGKPIAEAPKDFKVLLTVPFQDRYLFERFAPAILSDGEYIAISEGKYLSDPEALAPESTEYPQADSKKGILLDAATLDKEELTDLNVKRVVYNIPLSLIIGESESDACKTIDFAYNGKTYPFNAYRLAGFDSLFANLTDRGYHITAIILNDWNEEHPEMIHPMSRSKTRKSMYYAFNTEEEDGVRLTEATALFLAKRYSGGAYGMVSDWVIANEVNQQKVWNYMDTTDLTYYTESFEKSFRTFYNAIKSQSAQANVYFSIDHDWNHNGGSNDRYFNGRDFLYCFNEDALRGGNYDWGISIHPYSNPLPKVKFWEGAIDKTEDAMVITPMNLSVLTDVLKKKEFRNPSGQVRSIGVTELGFSSNAGERLQAAAYAYCYYIMEDNEYIDSFLMNRQTDDAESLKSGLALGIYNKDYSPKYIKDVFAHVDTPEGKDYLPEMLEIIGYDSLEEALEKAR